MEAVREAILGDQLRLSELADELKASIVGARGGPLLLASLGGSAQSAFSTSVFSEHLADDRRRLLVGTLDGSVTGFAACHFVSLDDGTLLGLIDACYVEPEARDMGLGNLLVAAALEWLRLQGCTGVDGTALPGDRQAKGFFETAGFKARMLVMHHHF